MSSRIYLDNAATSWPKRAAAVQAASDFVTQCGASAGRGSYGSSQTAERWLFDARRQLAQLLGALDSRCIAFCNSGTHAINAALMGLLSPGDHVLTTQIEHNSVLRPLHRLSIRNGVSFDIAPCDNRGWVDAESAKSLIRDNTKLIVIGHASNVTGAVQDLAAWSKLAKQSGAILMMDASQTLGYLPINVHEMGIDILAAAGHKGLQALPGTGLLYVAAELHSRLQPIMTGGTGVLSESIEAEIHWPQTIEVGNYNVPGIVSMAVAAEALNRESSMAPVPWQHTWLDPLDKLVDGLRQISGVRLVGYTQDSDQQQLHRVPLLSLTVDGWGVHDLAQILDSSFGIEVRSGYHCSALVHNSLGTNQTEGTLRISPGHSTSDSDVETLLSAIKEILNQ